MHFDSSKTKVLHFAMNPAKKAANLKALNRAMCAVGPPAAARVPTVPARSQSAVGDALLWVGTPKLTFHITHRDKAGLLLERCALSNSAFS